MGRPQLIFNLKVGKRSLFFSYFIIYPIITATEAPTAAPTIAPAVATDAPSFSPSAATVTETPTLTPVVGPTTEAPTGVPTATPTVSPTAAPTATPTITPTGTPVVAPTIAPTSPAPSVGPTAVPSDSPSIAPIPLNPTPTPVQIVLVRDYYISFLAPSATREPTQAEYEEMLTRINDWFEMQFTAIYANSTDVQFLGAQTSNDFTLYGLNNNIPPRPAEFNIYMNFDFSEYTFSETSNVPTTQEVFEIMRLSITRDFILQVVRTFSGTPFESTVEVFFAASEMMSPP